MKSRTTSRIALRVRHPQALRPRLAVEQLENRILPSVNLVEAEPNNTVTHANVIPHVLATPMHVSGGVASLGDKDWFAIQLDQGDVIGATLQGQSGLNPALRMVNSVGDLIIASDDCLNLGAGNLPRESPLAHEQLALNDSEIYYVMSAPGTYYLTVSSSGEASTGKYQLDMLVARPGMEARPVGTQQILYLDFDGARVNFNRFANTRLNGLGQRTLSPLSDFLTGWGLTAADEHAVIDEVVAKVADKLSAYVRANGLNGDFAASGIPGQFGIEIRNSRDNPDEFGTNPLMSRVVVGGTEAEAGFVAINALAYARDIDVGNFKTDDEAVVTLDFIAGGLAVIPIQPPATTIDFVATGIASVVAHEAGHLFGCFHTDQVPTDPFVGTPGVMDPHPQTAIVGAIGPDLVFGTADDGDLQLSVEAYFDGEPFRGLNDTLNTVAFGLSTGKGLPANTVANREQDASFADAQGLNANRTNEPRISISDVSKAEGKKSQTTLFNFTVTLSAAYDQAVTISFRTVNISATSDNDYIAKSGMLTFAPGETTKTITIEVKGDSKKEADETFYLDLFGNSGNSLFTKYRGTGTILNDD